MDLLESFFELCKFCGKCLIVVNMMWRVITSLLVAFSFIACKEVAEVQALTGVEVVDMCMPRQGSYDLYMSEIPSNGVSCGAKLHWVQKWTLDQHPIGMHLTDDFCSAAGSGPLVGSSSGTYDATVQFTDDWSGGTGTMHMHKPACDSKYSVIFVRQ